MNAPARRILFPLWVAILTVIAQAAPRQSGNIAMMDSLTFDTVSHRFALAWKLDTAALPDGVEASITVACGSSLPGEPAGAFIVTSLHGDTAIGVASLIPDTVYTAGVWLRRNGVWIPPDSPAIRTLRIPRLSWQPIAFFEKADTVHALSGCLKLWHDGSSWENIPVHFDTVRVYSPPDSIARGFIKIGPGIRFTNAVPSPPLYVGIRYDSVNQGMARGIGMYRDSAGILLVERGAMIDTAGRCVYVQTGRLDLPFVLLADTLRPWLEIIGDTAQSADSVPVAVSFRIHDNIGNVSWRLLSGPGSECLFSRPPLFYGTSTDTNSLVTRDLTVEGASISGLRAYIVVDDGTFADTVNVSRRAIRRSADAMSTGQGAIQPVAVVTDLDSSACRYGLRSLFARANGGYDKKEFRIYRWLPNAGTSGGWMEYSPSQDSLFSFVPGRLFWLISGHETLIDFGQGRTPSLRDTFAIKVLPKRWTDFSMPYGFDVPLGEVVAATGPCARKMHLYKWIPDKERNTFAADPLFCGGVPGLDSLERPLPSGRQGFYTVYNPFDTAFTLRIPPMPLLEVSHAKAGMRKTVLRVDNGLSVRIDAHIGNAAGGTVICAASASAEAPQTFPVPPAFGLRCISVREPGTVGGFGMVVLPLVGHDSDLCYDVVVSNPLESSATLSGIVKQIEGDSISGGMLFVGEKTYAPGALFSLTLKARETMTLAYAFGSPRRLERSAHPRSLCRSSIVGISPHSRTGTVTVTFFPGTGAKQSVVQLFDLAGKHIAEAHCGPSSGIKNETTTLHLGAAASGCIIIRLSTLSASGRWESDLRKLPVLR